MPCGFTEYDSPMFLHIDVDEIDSKSRMVIKVIQSEDLKSVDNFMLVKTKKY